MTDLAIRATNISKRYRIGVAHERHDTLRDALAARLRRNDRAGATSTIWALQDVSFEVQRGEVVGVIGRNGAGKSTLLKVLSRITEPTSGSAEIQGRVGSLLEVGTGFHPELTGRENIYLNGAILGMRRTEIAGRFDEIVAFAEVEKFLDTPVKRYSSGMYVRLAFAVAAHLEPEILLVDEVLAVGDAEFQRKCLGKMSDVAGAGRTVLFVSHNMSAVQRLCGRVMRLESGCVRNFGGAAEVVGEYVVSDAYVAKPAQWIDLKQASRRGAGPARFSAARFSTPGAERGFGAYSDAPLELLLLISSARTLTVGSLCVVISDQNGTKLLNADTISQGTYIKLDAGDNLVRFRIERLHLKDGHYGVGLWLADPTTGLLDFVESAFGIQVVTPELPRFGIRPTHDGVVTCDFDVEKLGLGDEGVFDAA